MYKSLKEKKMSPTLFARIIIRTPIYRIADWWFSVAEDTILATNQPSAARMEKP
jgi:hypothetical protein